MHTIHKNSGNVRCLGIGTTKHFDAPQEKHHKLINKLARREPRMTAVWANNSILDTEKHFQIEEHS